MADFDSPPLDGDCAPGWEPVRDAFLENFRESGEVGASVAVAHHGRLVVDLAGGWVDPEGSAPYVRDTLQLVFSTTKGIAAMAVAMLVDRGLCDYHAPVADYWPEFAVAGKETATVAQLLSHQCGLHTVEGPLTLAEALEWDAMCARLADTAPHWPIGTGHGYHALTYGWLAGELVRRIDGRTPGRFVREEIAGPLGAEMHIGLPAELEARVAPLCAQRPVSADPAVDPEVAAQIAAVIAQVMGPDTRGGRALSLNGAFGEGAFNRRDVHAAELPAANGITNARSLATIYSAAIGEPVGPGPALVTPATLAAATASVTPDGEGDLCLVVPTSFAMGFMTSTQFAPLLGPGTFGHPGAGGSVACADPASGLVFAYAMNAMAANLAGDVRAERLTAAVRRCAASF